MPAMYLGDVTLQLADGGRGLQHETVVAVELAVGIREVGLGAEVPAEGHTPNATSDKEASGVSLPGWILVGPGGSPTAARWRGGPYSAPTSVPKAVKPCNGGVVPTVAPLLCQGPCSRADREDTHLKPPAASGSERR